MRVASHDQNLLELPLKDILQLNYKLNAMQQRIKYGKQLAKTTGDTELIKSACQQQLGKLMDEYGDLLVQQQLKEKAKAHQHPITPPKARPRLPSFLRPALPLKSSPATSTSASGYSTDTPSTGTSKLPPEGYHSDSGVTPRHTRQHPTPLAGPLLPPKKSKRVTFKSPPKTPPQEE